MYRAPIVITMASRMLGHLLVSRISFGNLLVRLKRRRMYHRKDPMKVFKVEPDEFVYEVIAWEFVQGDVKVSAVWLLLVGDGKQSNHVVANFVGTVRA